MRVGIDCSCVAKPERTGVARYCEALLHELPALLEPDDSVRLLYRLSRYKRRRYFERIDDPRFSVGLFQDGLLPFTPSRVDVIHGPDLRIPSVRGVPRVSTVHDLSALALPGIARESFRQKKLKHLTEVAAGASVIMCISPFTEQAFLERFPQAEGRTRVVPLGLSHRFGPQDPDAVERARIEQGIGKRYLLFVGQIAERKNLRPLLEAVTLLHLRPEFRDVELVLAGPVQSSGESILEAARTSPVAGSIKILGFVEDALLPLLYAGAQVFCFTGKGEGFGLPILEAMACECPVMVARAGASESTAGGAARLVDPDDPQDIAEALARLIESRERRDELVVRGRVQADQFSWRETARKTIAAYHDAIEIGVPA